MTSSDGRPDPRIAAFVLPDTFGDTIASRLAAIVASRLRGEVEPSCFQPNVEGPHFVYQQSPSLFLGRRGRGPVRVAWDTNLLIDYFEHGQAIWEGASLPASVPGSYGEELEGLQIVLAIWILYDIRFYILRSTLRDARRVLSARRLEQRLQAFHEFASAVSFVAGRDDTREPPPLVLPDTELRAALSAVPGGNDRRLVEECVRQHLHVFLTRDAKVLKARSALRPFGVYIGTPLDLLEELTAIGALHCLLDPRSSYWPAPRRERVAHIYHATLEAEYRADEFELREIQIP